MADPAGGDVLDDVAGLVENNLVAPALDAPGEPRFRLYEIVRAYAAELLDEATREQVETAYVERLTQQSIELSRRIRSPDHVRWMAEFRRVWPDLRRAWELAVRREDAERTCLAAMSLLTLWLDGSVLKAYDLIAASIQLAQLARPVTAARHQVQIGLEHQRLHLGANVAGLMAQLLGSGELADGAVNVTAYREKLSDAVVGIGRSPVQTAARPGLHQLERPA